ncbi:MAG: RagB/SusD family nutrient uptake outer membrane protein [Bacteroidales bacterium]|nr:RagB/SusD family nutrient uptake outer membrane protein [Bacteroidales bacterium]
MKNTLKYSIILLLAVMTVPSCSEDFLKSEPKTALTSANFYNTPEDLYMSLVGCYQQLRGGYGDFFQFLNIAADDCYGGGGYTDAYGNQIWDEFKHYNDLEINRYTWASKVWRAIRRCHVVVEQAENVDWGSQTNLKNQYVAEARMLRAYWYYLTQSCFGHIPLITSSDQLEITGQADPDDVYAYIAEDIKYAIENLSAVKFSEISTGDIGHVTKWFAEGFAARVFLFYTGYYGTTEMPGMTKSDVIGYLNDVIINSGHSLLPSFSSLWPWSMRKDYWSKQELYVGTQSLEYAGEYNPEIVFAIKMHTGFSFSHSQFMGMRGEVNAGDYDPFTSGWGMATITAKAYNWFEEGDTRRFASIVNIAAEGIPCYGTDQREFTGYVHKKYQNLTSPTDKTKGYPQYLGASNKNANPQDQIIMRYSDILLMAAELNLDTNPTLTLNCVNQVRNRAFENTEHAYSSVSKQTILDERAREFVFEALRYHDVLRQGLTTAKTILDVAGDTVLNGKNPTVKTIDWPVEKEGLFMIPYSDVSLSNGLLEQNSGW